MIPPDTIDQIRQTVDIVEVIGEYLKLKKRGRNYLALCPFHSEKTASFSVSQDKQIFHCFGCSKGGNVFTFLMEHEKMSFIEAAQFLARKAGITIREDRASDYRRAQSEKLAYANQVAVDYFRGLLKTPKYKSVVDDYMKAKRRLTDEAIEHFGLGLAGEEWDGLIKYAAAKDLSVEDLKRAELVLYSEKNRSYFDRFRQRLMIPIFNLSGKPIAFGGRTLKKGEPAKYMNSPETPLYVKGHVLYGLNLARDEIRKSGQVYVVEGYFDLISLWQVGIRNVVASSGTAFTPQQARLLGRFAETVYLFFDADSAGQQAALRSVDSLYDAGLEVSVVVAPEGEDPDSIAVTYGRDKIEELTADAMGFVDFRVRGFDPTQAGIIGKEKLIKEFSALAEKITDPTRRALFLSEAADVMRVNVDLIKKASASQSARPGVAAIPGRKYSPVEAGFVSLLFNNPGSIDSILETISPDDFDSKRLGRLYSAMIEQYRANGLIDAVSLVDAFEDPEARSLVTEMASTEWDPADVDAESRRLKQLFVRQKRKKIREGLIREMAEAEASGDNVKAARLLAEIKSYGPDAD